MNRPLKRKLANTFLARLDAAKAGKAYADITLVTGAGTTLAQEAAYDASGDVGEVAEPLPPFLAVDVVTQGDPDLPGVCSFEAVLHLKTTSDDASDGTPSTRFDADAILRDVYDVLMAPMDDAAAFSDANLEGGAFLAFANKPVGTDTRPAYRKPLHVYRMWHASAPTMFDGDNWHDQIVFAGHAQDMDNA